MTGIKIPQTVATLRKTSVLALNPVTLPNGATYQLTESDWVRFTGKLRRAKSGCWIWTGKQLPSGYGQLSIKRRSLYTHRLMYMLFVGDIPEGLHTDHLCRNRACCNPTHLEPVTCAENIRRSPIQPSAVNGQKTECIRGHPLSGDNLLSVVGRRNCRACNKIRCAKQYAKSKAARLAQDDQPATSDGERQWPGSTQNGTCCRNGHELTSSNVYTNPAGQRRCRKCMAEEAVRRYAKAKGALAASDNTNRHGR